MALLVIGVVGLVLWLLGQSGSSSAGTVPSFDPAAPPGGTTIDAYGIDAIAQAVSMVESGDRQYDKNGNVITSPAGALGIMQLMPGTAADLGVDPYVAAQNYSGGKTYLQQLYDRFGNWDDALAAYNWGPGNVSKALATNSPYPQSVYQYVTDVESQVGS